MAGILLLPTETAYLDSSMAANGCALVEGQVLQIEPGAAVVKNELRRDEWQKT